MLENRLGIAVSLPFLLLQQPSSNSRLIVIVQYNNGIDVISIKSNKSKCKVKVGTWPKFDFFFFSNRRRPTDIFKMAFILYA